MDSESPTTRLAELFNVNHVIMSQANPQVLPFAHTQALVPQSHGVMHKLTQLAAMEVRHRLHQLNEFGLLPSLLRGFVEKETTGNITIHPNVSFAVRIIFMSIHTWIVYQLSMHAGLPHYILESDVVDDGPLDNEGRAGDLALPGLHPQPLRN